MESIWMKCLALHLCLEVVFLLRKKYYQEVLLNLVEKTKQKYLLPKSTKCNISTSFDL
jgi:predicted translin family RNA/ssDNA-binding protein